MVIEDDATTELYLDGTLHQREIGTPAGWSLVTYSYDGKLLAFTAIDSVVLLEVPSKLILRKLDGEPTSIAFSRGGKLLVGSVAGSRTLVWDCETGIARWLATGAHGGGIAISPENGLIAQSLYRDEGRWELCELASYADVKDMFDNQLASAQIPKYGPYKEYIIRKDGLYASDPT